VDQWGKIVGKTTLTNKGGNFPDENGLPLDWTYLGYLEVVGFFIRWVDDFDDAGLCAVGKLVERPWLVALADDEPKPWYSVLEEYVVSV
jgi:hypothetical protein